MYASNRGHAGPRATGKLTIPDEIVRNIVALLRNYGELPLHMIVALYHQEYNEILDLTARNYRGGLPGLIRQLPHIFVTRQDEDGFAMLSYERARTPELVEGSVIGDEENIGTESHLGRLVKEFRKKRAVNTIMSPNSFLWLDKPWAKLLEKEHIHIVESCYERAKQIQPDLDVEVKRIRSYLRKYPEGRKISDLRGINVKVGLFDRTALSSLIDGAREMFYKMDMDKGEPLIFDGFSRTVSDLTGKDDSSFVGGPTPEEIVAQAINLGLYQKTLILVNRASVAGLKINVWFESMEENFYRSEDEKLAFVTENKLHKSDAMRYFLALARYNLIVLEPGKEFKNDIRAFMPKRTITFEFLKKNIPNLGKRNPLTSNTNSEITEQQEVPPNSEIKQRSALFSIGHW